MVSINRDKTFKCSHGEIFSTLEEAIKCDLSQLIRNMLKKDNKLFYIIESLPDTKLEISTSFINQICINELNTIVYWVMNNSNILEELITFNLDSIVHFKKLEEME